MAPFFTFLAIIAVIWTLSAIATAANKAKEAERRRRLQLELQRAASQRTSTPPQPPRRISEGIAARFPDVLLPPAPPQQRRMPAPPMPKRVVPIQKKQQRRAASQRRAMNAPVPPPPVPAAPVHSGSAPLSTAAPAIESAHDRAAVRTVDASALARWAKPATLRQQFMLTEIFQPPLALREER